MKRFQVKCAVCGKIVNIRKKTPFGSFPVNHTREGSNKPCHGFYETGKRGKDIE